VLECCLSWYIAQSRLDHPDGGEARSEPGCQCRNRLEGMVPPVRCERQHFPQDRALGASNIDAVRGLYKHATHDRERLSIEHGIPPTLTILPEHPECTVGRSGNRSQSWPALPEGLPPGSAVSLKSLP